MNIKPDVQTQIADVGEVGVYSIILLLVFLLVRIEKFISCSCSLKAVDQVSGVFHVHEIAV